ncbi:unnamed protein product [Parascedosporium putredinis]|uniref:F-box domain-containing protein n=1 Tax=Parascedosporium putredinis TaxID=1442378 RepID=A0A9P1H7K8_9PEZI|nr:unnamed protein product [Parascedosporium putredinis]CAI7998512.1 unnamed protein product [Parascedosporium putredinis]
MSPTMRIPLRRPLTPSYKAPTCCPKRARLPTLLNPPPLSSRPETAPKQVAEKLLKGKEVVGKALAERSGQLTLLELPVDILRLVVHEITHTNDLTSLALTNSTLYSLAVPQIYSRFDIVWPDSDAVAAESKSVDALTYGLSTLCLGSSFARRAHLRRPTPRPPWRLCASFGRIPMLSILENSPSGMGLPSGSQST